MKRALVAAAILIVTLPAMAQVSVGARHGAAVAFTYMEDPASRLGAVNGLQFIFSYGSIAIQPEALVVPEVFKGGSDIALSSLSFPLLLRFPVDVPGPTWLGLAVVAGPQVIFRFAGSSGTEALGWDDLNRWDLGAVVGIEVSAAIRAVTLSLDLRAGAGVLPIVRGYQARSMAAAATLGYRVTLPPRLIQPAS